MKTKVKNHARGGDFLLFPVTHFEVAVPEEADQETRMLVQTASDFIEKEVLARRREIDQADHKLMVSLLRKAGELGLLMLDIPKAYGGLGVRKTTSMAIKEVTSANASFSVSLGAHTGIGTLPIVYFGSDQQKKRYLPKLATGELLSCYALTEPTCGSDALAIKTKAVLSEDGKHYILNGTKQFISNAGFADIAIVFAKIDGTQFTAFIVHTDWEGVSTGKEEEKMGQKGSSTRQLILQNVKVPVENVLGEIGKGHKIAFSILNIGRYVLGLSGVGGAKRILNLTIKYGKERHAFQQPIIQFPALQQKVARMASRIYACESTSYRLAGDMDEHVVTEIANEEAQKKAMAGIENYSIEGAILKVAGSEMLDFVVDEAVQIHGGYGYLEEYEVCGAYRDSRVNRLYEGTNEINRMLIPGMLVRKAMRGQLDLFPRLEAVKSATEQGRALHQKEEGLFAEEIHQAEIWKQLLLYGLNRAVEKYGEGLKGEQEVLMTMADIVIAIYTAESAIGRSLKIAREEKSLPELLTKFYVYEAHREVRERLDDLAHALEPEQPQELLKVWRKLLPEYPLPWLETGRQIARVLIEEEKYPLGF